jgi:hypothetical protein
MNKKERQQNTNIKFIELLSEELKEWCELQNIEPSTEALVAYLIKHNLLKQSIINKYVTINLYPEIKAESKNKEEAVATLSNLLPLECRQIKNYLGNYYIKFKPNKFKFP